MRTVIYYLENFSFLENTKIMERITIITSDSQCKLQIPTEFKEKFIDSIKTEAKSLKECFYKKLSKLSKNYRFIYSLIID